MIRLIAFIAPSVVLILVVLYVMIRQAIKAIMRLREDEKLIRRNNARASYALYISVRPHWEKICEEILKKPLGPLRPWFLDEYTTEKALEQLSGEKAVSYTHLDAWMSLIFREWHGFTRRGC